MPGAASTAPGFFMLKTDVIKFISHLLQHLRYNKWEIKVGDKAVIDGSARPKLLPGKWGHRAAKRRKSRQHSGTWDTFDGI